MCLDILDHFHDLQVCTAVAGTLEGKACGGDGGVGIGVGRGDDVGRKGRVVAAAVFGMDDEADVKQFRFEASIGAVRAEETKDVFGGREAGIRDPHMEAFAAIVVGFGLIAVDGIGRESCDQADGLAQDVGDGDFVWIFVECVGSEDASSEFVHDIRRWHAENRLLLEMGWERALMIEDVEEFLQFLFIGEVSHEQEENRFFEAEAFFGLEALDEVVQFDSAVEQASGNGDEFAIDDGISDDGADGGQSNEDTGAIGVTQPAFGVVCLIERRIDLGGFCAFFRIAFKCLLRNWECVAKGIWNRIAHR